MSGIGGIQSEADLRAAVQREIGSLPQLVTQLQGAVKGQVVTALPASPFDGQEVLFLADDANGVMWRLRYRAASASAYKWELVGGSPLASAISGDMTNANNTFTALTGGPSITLPLAGDYDVLLRGTIIPASLSLPEAGLYVAGVVSNCNGIWNVPGQSTTNTFGRITAVTAGAVCQVRCANANSVSTRYVNFQIEARPVRVG